MIGCLTDPKKIHYMCSGEATSFTIKIFVSLGTYSVTQVNIWNFWNNSLSYQNTCSILSSSENLKTSYYFTCRGGLEWTLRKMLGNVLRKCWNQPLTQANIKPQFQIKFNFTWFLLIQFQRCPYLFSTVIGSKVIKANVMRAEN